MHRTGVRRFAQRRAAVAKRRTETYPAQVPVAVGVIDAKAIVRRCRVVAAP